MKEICVIILMFTVGASISRAQENKDKSSYMLEWTLKEKFKIPYEKIISKGSTQHPIAGESNNKKSVLTGDYAVSGGAEIEAEIHAAINPVDSNNIVVSPILQDASAGDIYCPIYYTKNFGATWQKSTWVNMPYVSTMMSGGGGDPVFAYDADGKLYFSWIDLYGSQMSFLAGSVNMGIFWAYSTNGGETWVKPQRDTILLGRMNVLFGNPTSITSPISDKQWMAVDRSNSQYRNNLYVSYVSLAQSGNTSTYQILCKTKPAGQDFFRTQAAPITSLSEFSFVQFSSITTDNNGNVHVTFYGSQVSSQPALWHSVSTDGGLTFSQPNKISEMRFNLPILQVTPYDTIQGINQKRTYPSPYLAGDKVNGNLYITWTAFGVNSLAGNGADVYFSRSTDNGANWSTPLIVNDDAPATGAHQYYSSIFVDKNSKVIVSWYDRRGDPNNKLAHYYIAESTDGGLSFGSNSQVTSVATDFTKVGSQNSGFGIGEYTQVVSTGYTTVPFWADGRTNDGDVDVYCAFISPQSNGLPEIRNINSGLYVSSVSPNPAIDNITLCLNSEKEIEVTISVCDITGRKLKRFIQKKIIPGTNELSLSVKEIRAGKYYFLIESDKGILTKPFIVK